MSKFKMRLKLTGLEIEIEGTRDDVPVMVGNLGQQMSGLLQPMANVAEGNEPATPAAPVLPAVVQANNGSAAPRKRTRSRKASSASPARPEPESAAQAVMFRHDASQWGTPVQHWKQWQKAMWLLYVVSQQTDIGEMSTGVIVETFNTHFRQAGRVRNSEVTRDLGKKKAQGGLVGEDPTKQPPVWYLNESGIRCVQEMIAQSLGQSEVSQAPSQT